MPRFAVARRDRRVEVSFDDGGMNLLSSDALRELAAVFDHAHDARLVVFRSGRARLFAAGADMAEMARFEAEDARAFAALGQELFARIEALPLITVALIDGDCFGGALDLAMTFDLRFATPRSRFSHPGARIGIVTGFGGTARWRTLLDRAAARRLFLGNAVLSSAEALQLGVVDRVGDAFEEELARLESLDVATTRMLKDLAPRAERLGARELELLARNLDAIYRRPSS